MTEKVLRTVILATAESLAPLKAQGRPRTAHSTLLDVFLAVLKTGMPWRHVQNMDFRTAHRHFMHWSRVGVFENVTSAQASTPPAPIEKPHTH